MNTHWLDQAAKRIERWQRDQLRRSTSLRRLKKGYRTALWYRHGIIAVLPMTGPGANTWRIHKGTTFERRSRKWRKVRRAIAPHARDSRKLLDVFGSFCNPERP